MLALYNHFVETSTVTFDIEPFTLEERAPWFEQFSDAGPYQLFIAETDGLFAGYAGSMRHRAKPAYSVSIETTIYVDPNAARGGVGRALYETLFEALKPEDLRRAFAGVTLPNDASVLFHRQCGFSEIGVFHEIGRKFGRFHDVMWFEKRI